MAILDTSVIVPLLDAHHPNHRNARQTVAAHFVWHVTGGVVVELTQVLRRLGTRRGLDGNALARQAMASLQSARPYRYLAGHDAQLAARLYHTHRSLSYVDAWGIAVAVERSEPLLTLDDTQARVYERLR